MSHRLVAILAVLVCVSCGGASLNTKLVPVTNLADRGNTSKSNSVSTYDSGKGGGGEIAAADMECPAADVAGSNLVLNLGRGCNNSGSNTSTAVIAATLPDSVTAAATLPPHETGKVRPADPLPLPPPPPPPPPTPTPTPTPPYGNKSGIKDPAKVTVIEEGGARPEECPESPETNTAPPSGSEQQEQCPAPSSADTSI